MHNAKLVEIIHDNFPDYSAIEAQLTGFDARFFCLGVSSIGMSEERYRHLTYDFTPAAATTLARLNPQMIFHLRHRGPAPISTEQGRGCGRGSKAKAENDLLKLPFRGAYMFRPGVIHNAAQHFAARPRGCRQVYTATWRILVRCSVGSRRGSSPRDRRHQIGRAP